MPPTDPTTDRPTEPASPPAVVTARAPAKLNLALAVGPPGPDGLHPIASWMVTVDLFDDLELRRLPPDRLSRYAILWHEDARCTSEIDWSIKRDLAVRAHLALERHLGHSLPVQLKLDKRIPVGGGLGGGSADAAAMLHAVNELFDLGLSIDILAEIGATLGSDVPFLVYGGSAVVEGTGDRINPRPAPDPLHVMLALPDVACNTADVYRRFDTRAAADNNNNSNNDNANDAWRHEAVHALADGDTLDPAAPFNELAAAAIDIAPALDAPRTALAALAERPAHVSGSGSTLFVVCDDDEHATRLAETFERESGVPSLAVSAVAAHPTAHAVRAVPVSAG